MTSASLPDGVLGMARRGPQWARWVETLPALVAELLEEWQLRADGEMMHGYVALVVPVRTTTDRPAVLKVAFSEDEGEHEHLALQHWHGRGAVQLLRADPHRRAMLLERLHQECLTELDDVEACEVVASLYSQLHVPALPQLRSLTAYVERRSAELSNLPRSAPLPRRLVEQALSGWTAESAAVTTPPAPPSPPRSPPSAADPLPSRPRRRRLRGWGRSQCAPSPCWREPSALRSSYFVPLTDAVR